MHRKFLIRSVYCGLGRRRIDNGSHGALSVKTKVKADVIVDAAEVSGAGDVDSNVRNYSTVGGIPVRFRTDLSDFSATQQRAEGY